jgi:hypothetical protein
MWTRVYAAVYFHSRVIVALGGSREDSAGADRTHPVAPADFVVVFEIGHWQPHLRLVAQHCAVADAMRPRHSQHRLASATQTDERAALVRRLTGTSRALSQIHFRFLSSNGSGRVWQRFGKGVVIVRVST